MSFLVINGIRTHYQRLAAKNPRLEPPPLVVFIHGLGFDSLASFYLTLAPPVAAAGMDVLTYDLRAHGRTERPSHGYRLRDFASDLHELLDGIDVREPVYLVGNSFGGTIAFDFAARHPERVHGIVSIESEPPTELWSQKMAYALTLSLDGLEAERNQAWVEDNIGRHHVRLAVTASKLIRSTTMMEDVPSGPFLDEAALAELSCPVLCIVGSEGFQSEDVRAVERLLPNCHTEVIAGQNHSVLVERHREVRPLLVDWIERHHERAVAR